MSAEIRVLGAPDAAEFQALRLRALRDDPVAFGSTVAEEEGTPLETVAARLAGDAAHSFVLGAALDAGGALVGLAACFRATMIKSRHRATVGGMFVTPEARGHGVGGALLDAVIARARAWPGLEQLTLTVVPDNAAARALYASRGFRSFGLEPRALKQDGRYHDVEHMWLPLDAP